MSLPQAFDHNEWFIIIGVVLFYTLIFLLPKRFPLSITILLLLFTTTVARLSDHLLSGALVDLYDVMDSGNYELFDLLTYLCYGPFGYLLVYLFDKLKIKGLWIVAYIVVWAFAATAFESMSAAFDVINYKGWKLTYSFSFYLFIEPITLLFFVYIKKEHRKNRLQNNKLN